VVGAGISGLSAAFELSRLGASVAVLEGRHVASGTSGYNTAKLSSLHGLDAPASPLHRTTEPG
jgi:glycine/D-amino acid oxidase-like deaminating enzyme